MQLHLPRLRPSTFSLRSMTVLLVVTALVLALVVQHWRAAERELRLRAALGEILAISKGGERMRELLGDQGLSILKHATRVEVLYVGRMPGHPRTPTGVEIGETTKTRLLQTLLDPHNYANLDSDDMPEPRLGFRFCDGAASLDVLVSLEGSSPGSPHEDIFVYINEICGEQIYKGHICFYNNQLHNLITAGVLPAADHH